MNIRSEIPKPSLEIQVGVCHQIFFEYGPEPGNQGFSGRRSENLPWFYNLQKAIDYLKATPFKGFVQTYLLNEEGNGPSDRRAGVYYLQQEGSIDAVAQSQWVRENGLAETPFKGGGLQYYREMTYAEKDDLALDPASNYLLGSDGRVFFAQLPLMGSVKSLRDKLDEAMAAVREADPDSHGPR